MIKTSAKVKRNHTFAKTWIVIFAIFALTFTIIAKLMLDVGVIKIIPTGLCNPESKGVNVHISSILKNNHETYNLNLIRPDGWYMIWDTDIENYGDSSHPLVIRTNRYDSLQITFFNNPYMGVAKIETSDGDKWLDLYTPNEYGKTHVDIPFAVTEAAPIVECIGIGLLLAAVVTGFIYFLVNCSKPRVVAAGSCLIGYIGAGLLLKSGIEFGSIEESLLLKLLLRRGFTRITNIGFVIAYGFFAELAIPHLMEKQHFRINEKAVFLMFTSAYASLASLYKFLIKPYASFHVGIYGIIQFILTFMFWFFCFYTLLTTIEGYICEKKNSDQEVRR